MTAPEDEFHILRNRAEHWRLKGSAYFITWRVLEGTNDLSDRERDVVKETIKHFHDERYRLYALVVMNDHVHVIVQPLGDHELSKIIQGWKSYTANRLQREHGRQGAVWQKDYQYRIIRGEDDLYEKANYIINNPLKRWPDRQDYPWVEWFAL